MMDEAVMTATGGGLDNLFVRKHNETPRPGRLVVFSR